MHQIAFVVYPGFELLDMAGPAAVFQGANRALAQRDQPARYAVALVSVSGGRVASSSGVVVQTSPIARLRARADRTLLVVGAEQAPLREAMQDARLHAALCRLVPHAQRFGSVCSGGFVLAAAGLLNGRRVASHWDACAALAQAFPRVQVDPHALYLVDDALWTSAGVTTGIDMSLAMLAQDTDAALAGEVAQRLVLYARRPGFQSQFSPVLQAQIQGGSPFAELIAWMPAHLDARLDVTALAERAHMSERSFQRRFVAATGQTPGRYVETARLDAARMLLARGLPLKAVAAQVGLFPPDRFAQAFRRRFGMSPGLFRELHAGL